VRIDRVRHARPRLPDPPSPHVAKVPSSESELERPSGDWPAEGANQARLYATGALDSPANRGVIDGDVLVVSGWCLFEGSHVARMDVVVDGRSVGLARLYIERPDIMEWDINHVDAPVAGFHSLISVARHDHRAESLVTVEATSLDGRRWRSLTHRVKWARPAAYDVQRGEHLVCRSTSALTRLTGDRSRVIVFTHDLSYGGGQLWLLELLRQLAVASALDCGVVAPVDGPLRGTLEDLGIPVHVTAPCPMHDLEAYERRVYELALLIRGSAGGAVLVNTVGVFPAVDAAWRAGVPCVWAIHESFEPAVFRYSVAGPAGMHPHVKSRFDAAFQAAGALIFEASQTADLFAGLCPPQRRVIVDYGVDVDEIDAFRSRVNRSALRSSAELRDDDVVVVVVGVFEPRKAVAAVVAAFDELARVHDRLQLVLVGVHDSPYSEAVREQVARSRARGRVHLVPVVADIYPWYAVADLLLCASDVESLPRSILEAMAFEVPVVSTDVFGIADLIEDGHTGWLTRPRDLEGLVGLLHLVLRMPAEERRAVGVNARTEVVRRHGDRSYGRVFARALAEVLDDPSCDLAHVFAQAGADARVLVR
jgi:D-inositol-3-phosphate glycosyltransferase